MALATSTGDRPERKIPCSHRGHPSGNPSPPPSFAEIDDYEDYDRNVFPIMHWWQAKFRDAFPDNLQKDRVSPEGIEANTLFGHDFINE